MTIGIYAVIITNHLYIGQSCRAEGRLSKHLWGLRKGTHRNQYMQNVFNKYGEESTRTAILQECERPQLSKLEIAYIKANRATSNWKMMNLTDGGEGMLGYELSDEHKAILIEANTGRKHTDEAKAKISKANKGRKCTDETKAKLSEINIGNTYALGHKNSDEAKAKISRAGKGRKHTDEAKEKISKAGKGHHRGLGRKHSDEHKEMDIRYVDRDRPCNL